MKLKALLRTLEDAGCGEHILEEVEDALAEFNGVEPAEKAVQRIIDHKFLVVLSNSGGQEMVNEAATTRNGERLWRELHEVCETRGYRSRDTWYKHMAVVRVPNHIQPHFGSQQAPKNTDGAPMLTLYYASSSVRFVPRSKVPSCNWEHRGGNKDIIAYVVHQPLTSE